MTKVYEIFGQIQTIQLLQDWREQISQENMVSVQSKRIIVVKSLELLSIIPHGLQEFMGL